VYTGKMITARDAQAIGLVDRLTAPPALLAEAKAMALNQAPEALTGTHRPAFDAPSIAAVFQAHTLDAIRSGRTSPALPANLAWLTEALANKGPLALRLAEQLFAEAESGGQQRFQSANLRAVAAAFSSEDAQRRLKAAHASQADRPRTSPAAHSATDYDCAQTGGTLAERPR
jgi:enoyl-CoA hydratase/carnithine racemase